MPRRPLDQLIGDDLTFAYLKNDPAYDSLLETLDELLPTELLDAYCALYQSPSPSNSINLSIKPLDLLLCAKQFNDISNQQQSEQSSILKKKLRQATTNSLADVIAEVETCATLSPFYKLSANTKTGNGNYDSDFWIKDINLFVEVKNFQHGRSDYEKAVAADMETKDAAGESGQYSTTRTGLESIGQVEGLLSVDMGAYDPSQQFKGMLNSAQEKFETNQLAVVFVTGIPRWYMGSASEAIENWSTRNPNSPVKSVLLVCGNRSIETNQRDTHLLNLQSSMVADDFLEKVGIT